MPLFKGVPNKTIKAIVPLFRLEEHAANAKIFDYGAPGDKMYILIQGVTPCMQVLTTAPLPLPHRYILIQGSITLKKQDGTYLATLTAQVIACDCIACDCMLTAQAIACDCMLTAQVIACDCM